MSKDVELSDDERSILEQMTGKLGCKIVTHSTRPARLCGVKINGDGAMVKVDQAVDKLLIHTMMKAGYLMREDAGPVLIITDKAIRELQRVHLLRTG